MRIALKVAVATAVALLAVMSVQAQADWIYNGSATTPTNWTDSSAWNDGDPEGGDYPGHLSSLGLKECFTGTSANLIIDSAIPFALADYNNLPAGADEHVDLTIDAGGSITIREPWIGRNSGTAYVDVNGGILTTTATTRLASGNNTHTATSGEVTIRNDGEWLIDSNLEMGVNSAQTSIIAIEDGLLSVGGSIAIHTPGDGMHITLDHPDAIFRWTGDKESDMNALIDNTGLRAGAGMSWDGDPVYDSGLGYTEVRVVPEPGTMMLLGMAALALLIRRRFVK